MQANPFRKPASSSVIWIVLILFVLLPFLSPAFTLHLINLTGIWIILALSLGLVLGYIGEISIGHAAFFGIGAYSSVLLTMNGWSFWAALPIAALITSCFGYLIGRVSLRVSGPYFAICTLAFGEIIKIILINWRSLSGGPDGIAGIPAIDSLSLPFGIHLAFETKMQNYYLIFFFVAVTFLVFYRILHSRVGYAILSVRADPEYAEYIGIDAMKFKRLVFVLSTFFCGIAGCLFAHYVKFISPYSFTVTQSFDLIIMVLIGGSGTLVGPAVGAAILTFIPEFLHSIQEYRMVIYGLLLMIIIIFFPAGLYGFFSPAIKSVYSKVASIKRSA
jgi:branched-chain amino acid transport system permease protein